MVERSKRIELRVTEDELMKIRDRMEEAGISSLTAYLVRMAIHGYAINKNILTIVHDGCKYEGGINNAGRCQFYIFGPN